MSIILKGAQEVQARSVAKIIYMHMFSDEKANDLFLKLMNEDVEIYAKEILE